ncbi:MAG: zinc ribbon domain-containing protein [Actinomycetota bacterium]
MAAAACDVCGASTPADARFCPQCGARLDVEVVDLTGPARGRIEPAASATPRANRLLVGLGAVLVLAFGGLWLFSGDDASDDEPEAEAEQDEPAPATDGAVPAADQTLETVLSIRPSFAEVEQLLQPGDAASIGLVGLGEALFWLTGEHVPWVWPEIDGRVRDPVVRRSDDGGTTWRTVPHDLPPDAAFGAITTSDDSLVLAGTDGDGALTVWRSGDGRAWTPESIADRAAPTGRIAIPTAIHPSPDGLIVLATHATDIGVLGPILPADFSHLRAVVAGLDRDRVDFIGPLGIRIEGPSIDDPAITDEMRSAIGQLGEPGSRERRGAIWLSGPDGWRGTTVDGQPTDATVLADGSPLVIGFTGAGTTEWTLDEAGDWDNRFASPDLVAVTTWRGQTIATGDGDLRVRTESGAWEPYGLFNALPRTLQDGFLVSAAGDDDILAVSLVSTNDGRTASPPGPALLAKDGFVLRYDISSGRMVVTTPGDVRIEMAPWQPSLPPEVTLDPAAPELVVRDPDTGSEAAFSFAELAQLERAATTLSSLFEEAEVLVSVDGRTWARGDVPENSFATQLVPVGDSVLTVVGRFGAPGAGLTTDGVRLLRISYS